MSKRAQGRINEPVRRPTSWWLSILRRRAEKMYESHPDLTHPIVFSSERERVACISFFNAAYRAEESGYGQAHRLADQVRGSDPELAEALELYGNEEGWHRDLLVDFLARLGGGVSPMGGVTRVFYSLYDRARDMHTIMLINLMFETIGSTTYRMTLSRVHQPAIRSMLLILMRDESFHVPLNVHFMREVMRRKGRSLRLQIELQAVYQSVLFALLASTPASRRDAGPFDRIPVRELAAAYAQNLGQLFHNDPDLPLQPPWALLRLFGLRQAALRASEPRLTSVALAELAADREAYGAQLGIP